MPELSIPEEIEPGDEKDQTDGSLPATQRQVAGQEFLEAVLFGQESGNGDNVTTDPTLCTNPR